MKLRSKLLVLSLLLVIVAALTIVTTYAWFAYNEETTPIVITTGTIKVNASLYVEDQTQDPKNNGTYDESTIWDKVNTEFVFNNCIPGEKYILKLSIENKGTLDGDLRVALRNIHILNNNGHVDQDVLKILNLTYINPNDSENKSINFSSAVVEETVDDVNYYRINMFEKYELETTETYDFYFQIEILGDVLNSGNVQAFTVVIGNVYVELNQIHN